MEKDYFLDRPEEVMYRDKIPNGAQVFICTKQMQPYAKELKDLNLITVTGNLTTSSVHARGQKVLGEELQIDKYGNIIIDENMEKICTTQKGRCTYLLTEDGEAVYTKEGFKYLEISETQSDKTAFHLLTESQICGKYKLVAIFSLEDKVLFKIPLCKYKFFNSIESLKHEAENLKIEEPMLHNGFITLHLNSNYIKITKAEVSIREKKTQLTNPLLFDYISKNFTSINNDKYSFNKKYVLNHYKFVAEQY